MPHPVLAAYKNVIAGFVLTYLQLIEKQRADLYLR
jgi:hypothetical protein